MSVELLNIDFIDYTRDLQDNAFYLAVFDAFKLESELAKLC